MNATAPLFAALLVASATASAAPPLLHQLPTRMTRLEFLGWSEDGTSFALRTQHGRNMGELAGEDQLRLIQVHDALTGAMIASVRVELGKDLGKDHLRRKAWTEARPLKAWKELEAKLKLTGRAALRSPDGWALTVEPLGKPRSGKLGITRKASHVAITWEGFEKKKVAEDASEEAILAAYGIKGKSKGEPGPGLKLGAARAAERLPLLVHQLPFSYRDVVGCLGQTGQLGRVVEEVRAYFSPRGTRIGARVLLALHADLEGAHEEDPQNEVRYYLRSLGPQLQVIAPPTSEAAARRLCEDLAAAGLPVTQLSLEGKRQERTQIYHRGANGAALAQKVSGVVTGQPSLTKLTKPGWLDLVVVLGGR